MYKSLHCVSLWITEFSCVTIIIPIGHHMSNMPNSLLKTKPVLFSNLTSKNFVCLQPCTLPLGLYSPVCSMRPEVLHSSVSMFFFEEMKRKMKNHNATRWMVRTVSTPFQLGLKNVSVVLKQSLGTCFCFLSFVWMYCIYCKFLIKNIKLTKERNSDKFQTWNLYLINYILFSLFCMNVYTANLKK